MKLKGITIIEILLSVAMISILAAFSVPLSTSFNSRNDLDMSTLMIVSAIRKSQSLATAAASDSYWGVKIFSTSTILFSGTDYVTRNTVFDEVYENPGDISVSGVSEIVFKKMTGAPVTYGTTTLTSGYNYISNIYINENGVVAY